jgi:hypothetical protein
MQEVGSVRLRTSASRRGAHPFCTRADFVFCADAVGQEWRSATCGGLMGVKVGAVVARSRVSWSGGRLTATTTCGEGRSGRGGQVQMVDSIDEDAHLHCVMQGPRRRARAVG